MNTWEKSSRSLGAERVIAIDRVPARLRMAERHSQADTINFDDAKVYDRLMEMTGGRGPDRCIDAVGAEAHGSEVRPGDVASGGLTAVWTNRRS